MMNQLWFTSLSRSCWWSFSFTRAACIMSSSSNRARRVLVSSLSRWSREKFLQMPRFRWSSSCSFWSFSISCLSSHHPSDGSTKTWCANKSKNVMWMSPFLTFVCGSVLELGDCRLSHPDLGSWTVSPVWLILILLIKKNLVKKTHVFSVCF